MTCPSAKRFHALVNMSPTQIRAWSRDPRSREFSEASTRARLPALATLKAKPVSQWTAKDCAFAARVVSYAVSLRNWGHAPGRCKPKKSNRSKK